MLKDIQFKLYRWRRLHPRKLFNLSPLLFAPGGHVIIVLSSLRCMLSVSGELFFSRAHVLFDLPLLFLCNRATLSLPFQSGLYTINVYFYSGTSVTIVSLMRIDGKF